MGPRRLEDLLTILEAEPYKAADLDADVILLVRELLELERQERELYLRRRELHLRMAGVFKQLEALGWGSTPDRNLRLV